MDELGRVGRANDAPELRLDDVRELLEGREDDFEDDERELGFEGAFATEVLYVCSSLPRFNSIGEPFLNNFTIPVLALISVISIGPCLSPTGIW